MFAFIFEELYLHAAKQNDWPTHFRSCIAKCISKKISNLERQKHVVFAKGLSIILPAVMNHMILALRHESGFEAEVQRG